MGRMIVVVEMIKVASEVRQGKGEWFHTDSTIQPSIMTRTSSIHDPLEKEAALIGCRRNHSNSVNQYDTKVPYASLWQHGTKKGSALCS